MKTCQARYSLKARAVALWLCTGASVALSQTSHPPNPGAPPITRDTLTNAGPQISYGDKRFLLKAASLEAKELRLSRFAVGRVANRDIHEFAQRFVTDDEKASVDLTKLASARGVAVSTKDDTELEKWSKMRADVFDKDYIGEMVDAQKDLADLLKTIAGKADDPEIARYARMHLPETQERLRRAEALKRTLPAIEFHPTWRGQSRVRESTSPRGAAAITSVCRNFDQPLMISPPLGCSTWPDMYDDSSDAKNT